MNISHSTQITGTGAFARKSEAPLNHNSTFAKSAGGTATQDRLETFPPLRSRDREQCPIATTGSDFFGRTPGVDDGANKDIRDPRPDGEKKKRKRLLLLLLLLLTFIATFLGFGGLSLFGSDEAIVAVPVAAPATVTAVLPEQVKPEATTVASAETGSDEKEIAAVEPPVDDNRLPEEVIVPASIPARIADVVMPETQYNITYPAAIPPPASAVKSKTNFVSFEVNAQLAEDPETRVFSMVPSATGKGSASLAWSTVSGAVLFRCKDLEGNKAGSNYVLYYIDENDKAQRMMAFAVASGAELMLIPPRIPSRGVKRVVLTLEKNVKTLEGAALRREEVLYSDYKEKAILTKPLK